MLIQHSIDSSFSLITHTSKRHSSSNKSNSFSKPSPQRPKRTRIFTPRH